jgi:hypothetical protein
VIPLGPDGRLDAAMFALTIFAVAALGVVLRVAIR